MSVDHHSQAARVYYRLVRDFAQSVQPWEQAIYHDVAPDERWDITLTARKVYGDAGEFLAVMAAAGLDSVDQPLEQQRLVLPTADRLRAFKRRAGFESRADHRKGGRPTWRTD
ncbi:hypothetical protein [Halomonas salipaludis]|uniref:Uncharacterized protein n=1 Tax=Halomonas salipaludis TaxID=2032625 RepID=A0A2A2F2R4_9GAMM|nr:hypothetical protein [Halomonas salipaludis]PAU79218.1 hypothetical protein CK498_02285 [Halomonas salipaludis]